MKKLILQHRRGTKSAWEKPIEGADGIPSEQIPADGELVIEKNSSVPKVKIGDGSSTYSQLPYITQNIEEDINSLNSQVQQLVAGPGEPFEGSWEEEVANIRVNKAGYIAGSAGEAVRTLEGQIINLKNDLNDFIGAQAVDGLEYNANNDYMLYLTSNGTRVGNGVQVIGGSGGSGASINLKISNLLPSSRFAVTSSQEEVYLKFLFSSKEEGEYTSDSFTVEIYRKEGKLNNEKPLLSGISRKYSESGSEVPIKNILVQGINSLDLHCYDIYGNERKLRYEIELLDLILSTSFNGFTVYDKYNEEGLPSIVQINYSCSGATRDRTLCVYSQNKTQVLGTQIIPEGTTNLTYYLSTEKLAHGSNSIELQASVDIIDASTGNRETHFSNIEKRDVLVQAPTETSPMMASTIGVTSVKAGEPISIPYYIYHKGYTSYSGVYFIIEYEEDGSYQWYSTVSDTINSGIQTWPISDYPTPTGDNPLNVKFTIKYIYGEDDSIYIEKSHIVKVEKSDISIKPITTDIILDLQAQGKSNGSSNKDKWTYQCATLNKTFETSFSGMNWLSGGNGWDTGKNDPGTFLRLAGDARATINCNFFDTENKIYNANNGLTVELDYRITDVSNPDATIISCVDKDVAGEINKGFWVNANRAYLKGSKVIESFYKENERINLTFTIAPQTDTEIQKTNRFVSIYLNGVASSVIQYTGNSPYSISNTSLILGGSGATLEFYGIRVYNRCLSMNEVVNNYIANQTVYSKKESLFKKNNLFKENKLDVIEVGKQLPIIYFTGKMPEYKDDKQVVHMDFVDPNDASRNFANWYSGKTYEYTDDGLPLGIQVQIDVQGTSSSGYIRKNWKIKLEQKAKDANGETLKDENGNTVYIVKNESYQHMKGEVESKVFCIKVDYAESTGTHNTQNANLVETFYDKASNPLPPQKGDSRVRTSIAGFPCVIFHREKVGDPWKFSSKANFNFDKGSEEAFGFDKKWGVESWEFCDNGTRCNFKQDFETYERWLDYFEPRYTDKDFDALETLEKRIDKAREQALAQLDPEDSTKYPQGVNDPNYIKDKEYLYTSAFEMQTLSTDYDTLIDFRNNIIGHFKTLFDWVRSTDTEPKSSDSEFNGFKNTEKSLDNISNGTPIIPVKNSGYYALYIKGSEDCKGKRFKVEWSLDNNDVTGSYMGLIPTTGEAISKFGFKLAAGDYSFKIWDIEERVATDGKIEFISKQASPDSYTVSLHNDTPETRLKKFEVEFNDKFNLHYMSIYYVYTFFALMLDQRAKNLFLTYWPDMDAEGNLLDTGKWYPYFYDNDTCFGINNSGILMYDYYHEDTDYFEGKPIYNGITSVLWKNFSKVFATKIQETYKDLRDKNLNYDNLIDRFIHKGSDIWSASIYNEDAKYKYLDIADPNYTDEPVDTHLSKLMGSGESQLQYYLNNRFSFCDSKWGIKAYADNAQSIELRLNTDFDSALTSEMTITPNITSYTAVRYGGSSSPIKNKIKAGQPGVFRDEGSDSVTDKETYILNAPSIASTGDMSNLRLSTAKFGLATNITEICIGSEDVARGEIPVNGDSFSIPQEARLLRRINLSNCWNLQTDISLVNSPNLNEVRALGTRLTEVKLPETGYLTTVHLPHTITTLKLNNQNTLSDKDLIINNPDRYDEVDTSKAFDPKETYYIIDGHTYIRVDTSSAFDDKETYYTKEGDSYEEAIISAFEDNVTYYTRTDNYVKIELEEFDPETSYYTRTNRELQNIKELYITNCKHINGTELFNKCLSYYNSEATGKKLNLARVRIDNVTIKINALSDLTKLYDPNQYNLQGFNKSGQETNKIGLVGTVEINTDIKGDDFAPIVDHFDDDLVYTLINGKKLSTNIIFKDDNGTILLEDPLTYSVISKSNKYILDTSKLIAQPTRAANAQYTYTWNGGWSTNPDPNRVAQADALTNIIGTRTLYPTFDAKENYYTVTFKTGNKVLYRTEVPYGTKVAYDWKKVPEDKQELIETNGLPLIDSDTVKDQNNYSFLKWSYNFEYPIVEDTTIEAQFIMKPENIKELTTDDVKIDNEIITGVNEGVVLDPLVKLGSKLEGKVKGIASEAFANQSLEYFSTGDYIESIGTGAFKNNKRLLNVYLGKAIISLGSTLFEGCSSLSQLTYNCSNGTMYNGLQQSIIDNDLDRDNSTTRVKNLNLIIGSDVTKIGQYIFNYTNNNMNNRCALLDFSNCREFNNSDSNSKGLELDLYSFRNLNPKEIIWKNNTIKDISTYAFSYNTNITDLIIPEGVKNIGLSAFINWNILKTVELPSTFKPMNGGAFVYCPNIEQITSKASGYQNGKDKDYILDSLNKLIYTTKNITSDKINAISNLAGFSSYCMHSRQSLDTFSVPSGITTIPESCFNNCTNLKSITLNDVNTIGSNAFAYTALNGTLDCSNVISFGAGVFGETKIQTLIIGSQNQTLTLALNAFMSMRNLETVYIQSSNVNYTGDPNWFQFCPKLTDIYVAWSEGDVAGADASWGAPNKPNIHYNYKEGESDV